MIDCSKCPNKGACCGIIPMSKESIKKESFQVKPKEIIEDDKEMAYIITDDLFCVYLNRETRRCSIYENRPEVCKLYGVSKDKRLQCAYFKPSGNKRSEASKKQVEKYIDKMIDDLNQGRIRSKI